MGLNGIGWDECSPAYADDLVIIWASINEIKTSVEKLFKASQNMDLMRRRLNTWSCQDK